MNKGAPSARAFALVAAVVVVAAYAGLARYLPQPQRLEVAQATPGATAGGECDEPGHGPTGHVCGLDAKAMLTQFQAAITERGRVHTTEPLPAGLGLRVRSEWNLGVAAGTPDLEALARAHGAELLRSLPTLDQALVRASAEAAEALRADPRVRYLEPNLAARVALTPNDPFFPQLKGHQNASLERAWDLTTGDPRAVVAVLDTGVDPTHPDLRNRLLPGFDFVNNTATLRDDNGHGTAMCGIVAAEGGNSLGVVGVAFNSRVLPVKVADANGLASVADVAAGIDYAIQQNAKVINLSLGTPIDSQALRDAVDRALNAGVVVVAAAGNDPVHHEMFPAAHPGVVSVTAMSSGVDAELSYECVLAEGVEVGAPGEGLVTTLPGDVYGFVSGSSAASAFTAGVASLVIARTPGLSAKEVARTLAEAGDRIDALAGLETTFRFGRLNAERAVLRSARTFADVAVTDIQLVPRQPNPGQQVQAVVTVTNQGHTQVTGLPVRLQYQAAGQGRIEVGVRGLTPLIPGDSQQIAIAFAAPAANGYQVSAIVNNAPGETEVADNRLDMGWVVAAGVAPDVRIVRRWLTAPDVAAGTVTAFVELENAGTAPVANLAVNATVERVVSAKPGSGLAPGNPQTVSLGQRVVPALAVGGRETLSFVYTIPTPAPAGLLRCTLNAVPQPGEMTPGDNAAIFDFMLGQAGPLTGLYQQSNGVDLIPDAPWRIEPGVPYVPVQVFVPSKGGRTASTSLNIDRTRISVRDTPTGPATLVYEDTAGAAPSLVPGGFEIIDELGALRSGPNAFDVFGEDRLDVNGRHDILRVPRGALGVVDYPAAPEVKFVDVKVDWTSRRNLIFGLRRTRHGSHRVVLRVGFSPAALPQLPGDNHYYDVHHHTIAEWYFGSALDIFAPRKAYGGPLQMVFESCYAMGFLKAPTAGEAWGRIITTDHMAFNNRTIPDPDGADHRPPFGPQAPGMHPPGIGQHEAYRNVLGPTAGEEVAFKQDVPLPKIHSVIDRLLDLLPGLPLGAHMLLNRANHVEGPWHGGGWLKGPGNPPINVDLFPLLGDLATQDQGRQGDAFIYAAHPFSGMGWRDDNLEGGFGLDPARRTRDAVHPGSNEFVLKGLQFFNGRGARALPKPQIDFNDLNPWADATFAQGVQEWDEDIWAGLAEYQKILTQTLEYAFTSDPETKFVRKIYAAAGSDAHGDFNFSTGRTATPISLNSTYSVGDEALYRARTYVLGDGKQGPTHAERWMAAYADGNTVLTDGPLAFLELDAHSRWDSDALRWHDLSQNSENKDGQIGGDGPLDGGRTALVRRGSSAPRFRYRYGSTPEWGAVASLKLYKNSVGQPNPTISRNGYDHPVGVADFALAGENAWHERDLDANQEGPVDSITAFQFGAYTGVDPDVTGLGPNNYRCWTNPIYAVPYDVQIDARVDPNSRMIQPGELTVTYTFDVSMDPTLPGVEVKALDQNGNSSDGTFAPLAILGPVAGSGWSDRPGIKNSVLTLTNSVAIPLNAPAYPAAGRTTLVVYFRDAPRDAAGNALNRIADTVETQGFGPGSGPPPGTTASGSTASGSTAAGSSGSSGTTAAGATPGSVAGVSGTKRSSSSGCSLGNEQGSPWPLALLAFGALYALRRRS
ncbi:MAG: S8 family serine peptidase [Planctomycetes bacterium]|nr:S8 family serine peptidase [Planctomycetota bacterium]